LSKNPEALNMNIHFISIGGTVMHNLAIALHQKGYQISGSDQEIFEPSRSRLEQHGLLPECEGWDPLRIHPGLDAVILGMNAGKSNPELKRACELGIRAYSFPEYLYEQSRNKKRVVIGGTHGKTTITAMIMHVLQYNKRDFDYMVSSHIHGFDEMVRLTDTAPCIILEGDEYLSSAIDPTPKFHQYNPHMTLLSGIAWDHMNLFRTFESYKKQFQKFLRIATGGGKVFYYDGDPVLGEVVDRSHWSLLKIPYKEHPYKVEEGRFILETRYGSVPLNIIGRCNMQNVMGAMLICRDLGIEDHQFYSAIPSFKGAVRCQQLLSNGNNRAVYLDFASAPSSVEATVNAFREAYREQKLITCLELHSCNSLNMEYLPLYHGTLNESDQAMVYYNPKVVKHKKLPELDPGEVRKQFGKEGLMVYNDVSRLEMDLKNLEKNPCVLLLMTTGNFSGLDLKSLAREVVGS
jgi:UDP-N-acetylmuramate: L-alanyl-gamma-D-glutamyl-meso-diaminopimelate ligase